MADQSIFRRESLEKLSSPDELDRLFTVVRPRAWIPLGCLAAMALLAIVWAFLGRIPETVDGIGVLAYAGRVQRLESSGAGRILEVKVRAGDIVRKGQELASLDQPELRQRLERAASRLEKLRQQDKALTEMEEERLRLEQASEQTQRSALEEAIKEARELAELAKSKSEQHYLQLRGKIADYILQSKQLGTRSTLLKQELIQSQASRKAQLREQQDTMEDLQEVLDPQLCVRSKLSGRVLEIAVQPGEQTAVGARFGVLELTGEEESPTSEPEQPRRLKVLAYFTAAGGAELDVGERAQVTPVTIKRERHGSMLGTVTRISQVSVPEEVAAAAIGDMELVKSLSRRGGMIEVDVELDQDPATFSGFRWTSGYGPRLTFSAGMPVTLRATVERRAPITLVFPFLKGLIQGGG